jgi:hypothetical protein
MRMSRTITLTLVSAAMLTACVTSSVGCGRNRTATGDRTVTTTDAAWYDAKGNKIPENWTTNADGRRVPDPHPCDRTGKPWATDADGNLIAPTYTTTTTGSGTTYRSHPGGTTWIFGGNGYRGSAPAVRSTSSSGGSRPTGSVTSGGFGSSGASISSGS